MDYQLKALAIPTPSITKPGIKEEFEIKEPFLSVIWELNFDGKTVDDLNLHAESFLDICDLFKIRGVSSAAIKLQIFSFSLSGESKDWMKALEPDSITTL